MQTIRNKQTGETLTGEISPPANNVGTLNFKIAGTSVHNVFMPDEWDILPSPLPTGIGAVVSVPHGQHFVRVAEDAWRAAGVNVVNYTDKEVSSIAYTILSQGVNLSGSAE